MAKIIHERSKCIGCGACAAICPDFIQMDEKDNLATVKKSKKVGENFELGTDKIGCLKQAAEVCPIQIIKIKE
jgi:ferredoxin